jgi:hypothetical protein
MGHYIVWCPELGQEQHDGVKVTATDPGTAAQDWAEWQDCYSAEYSIVAGADRTVTVLDIANGERRDWIVSGESVPIYRARLVVTPNG